MDVGGEVDRVNEGVNDSVNQYVNQCANQYVRINYIQGL